MTAEQREHVGTAQGFIAALDQSGGSTPGALETYGIDATRYRSDDEMFDLVHAMRTRIMTSASFQGDRVLGAILFESTMDREIQNMAVANYLWSQKQIVPFLKVDRGLAAMANGVQLMQANPSLGDLLARANARGVFGTKMRSLISQANVAGIAAVVEQQFDLALEITGFGLMAIVEPEVALHCSDKAEAEELLVEQIFTHLDRLPEGEQVMLKLSIPETPNHYSDLVDDPRVLRVAALSGGHSRKEAARRLALNKGVIASFSRALAQGLHDGQTDQEFDAHLDEAIAEIFEASIT